MTRIYYNAHTSMGLGGLPKPSWSKRFVSAWKRAFFKAFAEQNGSWLTIK